MIYPDKKEFASLAKKGNLIPVYKEFFADLETPVSSFMKLGDSKYSFLLESIEGSEKVARYSFIANNPSFIFKSKGNAIELIQPNGTINFQTDKDPLYEIKKIMDKYKPVSVKGLPRFYGGLVGYIGYDMVRFFEVLPDNNPDDLNLPDSIFMLTDTILIFDHLNHKIKIVVNAFVDGSVNSVYDKALKKIEDKEKLLRARIKAVELEDDLSESASAKKKIKSNFTKSQFKKAVIKAKKYIKSGDIIQVVLSQRFSTRLNAKPINVYRALRSLNPSPYMFYLKLDDYIMIGSSPELLVRCEDGLVATRPIAGTRPRGADEAEDKALEASLLNDPKELAEHIMLVDLGRNDIGKVCKFSSVKMSEFKSVERYSHVMHIVSEVTGRLKPGKDQYDVLRACFPAGTVSGAPKVRAMQIIDELENTRRGPYAGSVGYFSFSGNLDTAITIRTIYLKGHTAYIQAGAGIVADSKPDKEFEETKNKAKALLKAIEIANKGL